MNNVNLYQKQIEVILQSGKTVFQIINPDNTCSYYIISKFTPSFFSNVESLDFNTIIGVNITNFLFVNSGNDPVTFLNQLDKFLLNSLNLEVQFSKKLNYYKYRNSVN